MIFNARRLVRGQQYALSFDGPGNYVICSADAAFNFQNSFKLEVEIKTTATGTRNLISRDSEIDRLFAFRLSDGKPRLLIFVSGSSYYHIGNATVNDGEWHTVAVSYDGSYVRFFVDDVLDNSIAETRNIDANASVDLSFGYQQYGATNQYIGQMRNIRYWVQDTLVGRWPFREGSGATLGDTSGNGHDGTITGATWVKL